MIYKGYGFVPPPINTAHKRQYCQRQFARPHQMYCYDAKAGLRWRIKFGSKYPYESKAELDPCN